MNLAFNSILTTQAKTIRCTIVAFLMAGAIIFHTFRFCAFAKFIVFVKILPLGFFVGRLSVEAGNVDQE
jgi:hypothetical protein